MFICLPRKLDLTNLEAMWVFYGNLILPQIDLLTATPLPAVGKLSLPTTPPRPPALQLLVGLTNRRCRKETGPEGSQACTASALHSPSAVFPAILKRATRQPCAQCSVFVLLWIISLIIPSSILVEMFSLCFYALVRFLVAENNSINVRRRSDTRLWIQVLLSVAAIHLLDVVLNFR